MSTRNEANQDTIIISSDDDGSGDEACDDRKAPVVLAVFPSEKRVFTPTKKQLWPSDTESDSNSEVDESLRYTSCTKLIV